VRRKRCRQGVCIRATVAVSESSYEATLPLADHAYPATYMLNGRQYVVIAAGGERDPKWSAGGVYVAFALPSAKGGKPHPPQAETHREL
jgi:glucose dehydrogenase